MSNLYSPCMQNNLSLETEHIYLTPGKTTDPHTKNHITDEPYKVNLHDLVSS